MNLSNVSRRFPKFDFISAWDLSVLYPLRKRKFHLLDQVVTATIGMSSGILQIMYRSMNIPDLRWEPRKNDKLFLEWCPYSYEY